METSITSSSNDILADSTGSAPKVSTRTLESKDRTINSVEQAVSVCETMIQDWKKGITQAARITAKLNGERPYNQKKLKDAGKDWKTNISTGFLSTECSRILPRLYMPVKTARYLTAASLPPDWPGALEKTEYFRQTVTETIRSWPKFNFYIRGLAREVGIFGFAFNTFFDKYDWRPTLMRMDKGFVPQGTEVMEEPTFHLAKYDYKPDELLRLLKDNLETGRSEWKKDSVVAAINGATPPPNDSTYPNARSYEEMIRQSVWTYTYKKGYKTIQTWHLFSKEVTGKVSHYILLADAQQPQNSNVTDPTGQFRLLYEQLDKFDSMFDAVVPIVFDYGDGTIHGSWGAGQILYDLAAQVEKVRCDSIDNIRMTNKIKAQVPDAKNVNDVKCQVNDMMMVVSGAQFSGNTAGISQDIEGYGMLDQRLSQLAQEKIGAFVPPIPTQPSDIKAAQINAAMMKERELQEALHENWLIQIAVLCSAMTKRLCDPDSPDAAAQAMLQKLLKKITAEEIALFVTAPIQSVMEYTDYSAQKRAMFAQSVMKNELFNQNVVARTMAAGIGDTRFIDEICVRDGDQTSTLSAQRQQLMENAALALGQPVPVLPQDNDYVHMQTMKPGITQVLQSGNADLAEISLQHYAAHWGQGVNKKQIPDEAINVEKSWIAAVEKQIAVIREGQQIKQARQEAVQMADAQAQQIVQQEMAASGGMMQQGEPGQEAMA